MSPYIAACCPGPSPEPEADATCPAPNDDAISALTMDNCANCLLNFIIVITPIANIQYTAIVMKQFKYDMRLLLKVCKKGKAIYLALPFE